MIKYKKITEVTYMKLEGVECNDDNKTSDKSLLINTCGFQDHRHDGCSIMRKNGRVDYHFLFVSKGSCKVLLNGEIADMYEGEMLIYYPAEQQWYSFERGVECESYWVHFTGTEAGNLLAEAGLDGKQCKLTLPTDKLTRLFGKMLREYAMYGSSLRARSYLLQIFAELKSADADNMQKAKQISEVMRLMHENYSKNYTMDFYARACHLSTDRFAHIFKECAGISPGRYILNIRLGQVKYLLEYSDLTVAQIAGATGFNDALYLSRIFKQKVGISPKEWRKVHREG